MRNGTGWPHFLLVVTIGGALFALLFALPAAGAVTPKTLVQSRTSIREFAQDNGFIAWENRFSPDETFAVHIRRIRTGAQANFRGYVDDAPALGLAGRRAVWSDTACGNFCDQSIMTAALNDPVVTMVDSTDWNYAADEDAYLRLAGDGDDLVYAFFGSFVCDEDEVGNFFWESYGYVSRVVGRTSSAIPAAPASFALDVSSGRVLLAPLAEVPCGGVPGPPPPLEVREVATGNLVATFAPAARVLAVALDGGTAAVLTRNASGSKHIERYDATTGAFLASTWVTPTARQLDMGAGRIVFRTGRQIRLLNAATGAKRLLWTAAARPIDLSMDGRRVAWAENGDGRGYVRSIMLP